MVLSATFGPHTVQKCLTPSVLPKQTFLPNKRRRFDTAPSAYTSPSQLHLICSGRAAHEVAEVPQQRPKQAPPPSRPANSCEPSLPACLQPWVTDASRWWSWKYDSKIHYRHQGSKGPAILLIHGFGVGAFHFEQLLTRLSSSCQVWAIDLLGQGMSWPTTEPSKGESAHSISYAHITCPVE